MLAINPVFITAFFLVLSTSALAAEKIVTLHVENMTCMSCPYQVKKSLKNVEGVTKATASLDTQQAVVTYHDTVTNVVALTEATTNVGYPSRQTAE